MIIVVQADDCGIGVASTDRILDAGRLGRLDRVGIVANGAALAHAAARVTATPGLGISVHLNLVEGRPVAPPATVPLLLGRDGSFRHTFLSLWLAHALDPRRLEEQVEREIGAQIGIVRARFAVPTVDVDSHQYLHLLPFVTGIIARRATAWGVGRVRTVREPLYAVSSLAAIARSLAALNPLKLALLRWLSARSTPQLRRRGIPTPDYFLGVAYSGAMSTEVVRRGIRRIVRRGAGPGATVEIALHPGRQGQGEMPAWAGRRAYRSFHCSAARDREARTLSAPRFRELIERAEDGSGRRPTRRPPASWIEYWDTDSTFAPVMRRATESFFRASRPLMAWEPGDAVLDIGCGAGYLEDCLKDLVGQIHGVDTSPRLIGECRARFAAYPHLRFDALDPARYTNLAFLEGGRFTKIVCLSVVQYYRERRELAELLESIRHLAAPGALVLVADIPVGASPVRDALDLLGAGAAERMLPEVLSFILRSAFSPYRRLRASARLLSWPPADLVRLAEALGPEARIIRAPLTFNRSRVHLFARLGRPPRAGGP